MMISFKINIIFTLLTIFVTFDNTYAENTLYLSKVSGCMETINSHFKYSSHYTTGGHFAKEIINSFDINDFTDDITEGYANFLLSILEPTKRFQTPSVFCEDLFYNDRINCENELRSVGFEGTDTQAILQHAFKHIKMNDYEDGCISIYLNEIKRNTTLSGCKSKDPYTPNYFCRIVYDCSLKIESNFADTTNYTTGVHYAKDIIENHIYYKSTEQFFRDYADFLLEKIYAGQNFLTPEEFCSDDRCINELYSFGLENTMDHEAIIQRVYKDLCVKSVDDAIFSQKYIIHVKNNILYNGEDRYPQGHTPLEYCIGRKSNVIIVNYYKYY